MPLAPEIRLYTLTGPLEQHWERLGALPYWGHPWPGGQGLARYLLDHPQHVAGRHVLDLASGSGLVAVAAALAGAASVTAADVDPLARAAVVRNAGANGVRVAVEAADLLGTGPGAAPLGRDVDVVLAGDACYEPDLARRLLAFCRRVATTGALVLLGDPGRAYLDAAGLERVATYDVPTPEGVEREPVTPATVWRVTAPPSTPPVTPKGAAQPRS